MTETEIIIECAKLDGGKFYRVSNQSLNIWCNTECITKDSTLLKPEEIDRVPINCPKYTTSRDAIVPVIEKQHEGIQRDIANVIWKDEYSKNPFSAKELTLSCMAAMLRSTPLQLCEALLRATGKWKD